MFEAGVWLEALIRGRAHPLLLVALEILLVGRLSRKVRIESLGWNLEVSAEIYVDVEIWLLLLALLLLVFYFLTALITISITFFPTLL